MIFFGSKASKIGQTDIPGIFCEHCGTQNKTRLTVFGKYAHIYWIPFFPVGKKAVAECQHCMRTTAEEGFSPALREKYESIKSNFKAPFTHWILSIGLAAVVLLITVIGFFKEEDPRRDLLHQDLQAMQVGAAESDTLGKQLSGLFSIAIVDELHPESFSFLTKTSGNKQLILIKIPDLKKVEKTAREELFGIMDQVITAIDSTHSKSIYLGVHGKFNMMMVKTPTSKDSDNIVSEDPLYDFYGEKPVAAK